MGSRYVPAWATAEIYVGLGERLWKNSSTQHAVLKELAESEGYDSVSELVRVLLDRAIKEHQKKPEDLQVRSPKTKAEASHR